MPDLLFKLCPKCRKMMPVSDGARLCASCAEREKKRARKRDYPKEYAARADDPEKRRFYRSKQWQMTSKAYARSVNYRCEECGDIGTDVHHVMPIQTDAGWEARFDFENLRLLCVRCHNAAHGRTFRNGWGDGETEETPRIPDQAPDEGAEGEADGGREFLRVSDYLV